MEVIAAAIAAPVISAAGYIYVCQSLRSDGTGLRDAARPSIKKAAYLIAALGAEVLLAVLFNALYDVSLLKELRLLTLVEFLPLLRQSTIRHRGYRIGCLLPPLR